MTFIFVFASHVQIALRVSVTDPVIWWDIASLSFDWDALQPDSTESKRETQNVSGYRKEDRGSRRDGAGDVQKGTVMRMTPFGRMWIAFTIVWGALSIVLWSAHLPPA